jgi:hypothetical protein
MGSRSKGDPSAKGDAKFNYRFFFLRKLVYGNSLSAGLEGDTSPGRHCHSTLSLTAIDPHSLGIYTATLLSLLSFSAKMTVSPLAR